MARRGFLLAIFLTACPLTASAGDYIVEIGGRKTEVSLGEPSRVELPDGKSLLLTVRQKETLTFRTDRFSFQHKNAYRPSRSDLGDGVHQTALVTSVGTSVLIQEYAEMEPGFLVDLMLRELTKEEVDYGYSYEDRKISKTLADGQVVKGKMAITEHGDEKWFRSVLATSGQRRGLLIVTMIEAESIGDEGPVLDEFWKTLQVDP